MKGEYRKVAVGALISIAVVLIQPAPFFIEKLSAMAPAPSWWSGDCDANNYGQSAYGIAAYKLGKAYNGIEACGPGSVYQKGDLNHGVSFGVGSEQYEWECVELSMRYMYLVYQISPYTLASGYAKNIVSSYSGSRLDKKSNNGSELPTPGDILAMNGTESNIYGHTAIVTDVSVNSSGTGTIKILEQNGVANSNGSRSISVTGKVVGDNVIGWLHDPQSTPFTTFQSNTNLLYRHNGTSPDNTSQGMKASTSPSIKKTISSSYYIAFQANTGDLVGYAAANGATSTNQGMASASSPSVGVGVAL